MTTWMRDEAYSYEETARRGDFAAVIVPPEYYGKGNPSWGIQIFDEADGDAREYGETFMTADGLPTCGTAKKVAAAILEELAAARA